MHELVSAGASVGRVKCDGRCSACVELVVSGLLREIMVSGRAWWLGCAWVLVYICTELMKERP